MRRLETQQLCYTYICCHGYNQIHKVFGSLETKLYLSNLKYHYSSPIRSPVNFVSFYNLIEILLSNTSFVMHCENESFKKNLIFLLYLFRWSHHLIFWPIMAERI